MAYYPSCKACKHCDICDWKEEYDERVRKFDRMLQKNDAEFNHWAGLMVTMSCIYYEEIRYDT